MLQEIVIENLGVIERASVPLSPGFTALTGETGAGKTMILNALVLLRGGKASPALIRQNPAPATQNTKPATHDPALEMQGGATATHDPAPSTQGGAVAPNPTPGNRQLVIEGRWHADAFPEALEVVADCGGALDDDGAVIAVRAVGESRSKAHLGGRAVPAAALARFTDHLVTVHGQSDQIRLRTTAQQRLAVDSFASATHQDAVAELAQGWARRATAASELTTLEAALAARRYEAEQLAAQLAEFERVDPQPGEHAELTALTSRLTNIESLRAAVIGATTALTGSDHAPDGATAAGLAEQARRALAGVAVDDPALEPLAERAAELGFLTADLATDLQGYLFGLEGQPGRLEAAQQRLAELNTLTRAHRRPLDEVIEWAGEASLRLLELSRDDDTVEALREELAQLDTHLRLLAEQVSQGRREAALALGEAVTAELAGLGMAGSKLVVAVEPKALSASGGDQVTFNLATHAGAQARPIGRAASGGELSRLMLAIELTLAERRPGPLPTFVFDEVDAGIGGKAAVEVGRRLARLAQSTQVVVVTHLPQVAAFADSQLVVAKRDGSTTVEPASGPAREQEIARMLSGEAGSDAAIRHARELLASSAA